MAFCVTFVFTVTLSVFPAVTVDVKTVYGGNWGMEYYTNTTRKLTNYRKLSALLHFINS